ncbi:MAG: HAD-IIIA family hydrolase [Planctomycetes bacterium]|nr:HAD-IIIA family hydrolase [Planctomycetota bacterium]
MNRAVFLDRDGTLIKPTRPRRINTRFGKVFNDCVIKPSEIRLCSGVISGLKRLQAAGYILVIITNQSVVARGVITERQLRHIHRRIVRILGNRGIRISGVYYCPHHPEGLVKRYRRKCRCRKPAPGLILRAARAHRINLKHSFLIGDSAKDIKAARNAGVKGIKVTKKNGFAKAVDKII